MIKLLFIGDIVGRSGRLALKENLPYLIKQLAPDLVIANVENAARGFGITQKIIAELTSYGVDVMTTGNHTWDQRDIVGWINNYPQLLRPANHPKGVPGKGQHLITTARGDKILVINLMGRLNMSAILDCPFARIDEILKHNPLAANAKAILIDFHAESTSEKTAFGHYCDGRVSMVVGTHTHIPTADTMILPSGTGYQTDAGMSGDYFSVIGMQKDEPIKRFRTGLKLGRFEPANGEGTLCGTFVTIDDKTGLAIKVDQIRAGGALSRSVPDKPNEEK